MSEKNMLLFIFPDLIRNRKLQGRAGDLFLTFNANTVPLSPKALPVQLFFSTTFPGAKLLPLNVRER